MYEEKKKFEDLIENYLKYENSTEKKSISELEIRFNKSYNKIDYDNTIKKLYSLGFKCENNKGIHMLRIYNEYHNTKINKKVISRTRTEIIGVELIQEYCNTNNLSTLIEKPFSTNKIKMTEKTGDIPPIIFKDLNFKVAYQFEKNYSIDTNISKEIINNWLDKKKLFRHINRVRFTHNDYPIFVDLSIIKTNTNESFYTIQEAKLFDNEPLYEIELEIDNQSIGLSTKYNTTKSLITVIKKCIRIILSALQDTNYPIGNIEKNSVISSYMKLLNIVRSNIRSSDFIGPSSYTLQLNNISTLDPKNILKDYTVTDKADGQRNLLYIHDNGKIYMINTNMSVIFTGMITDNIKIVNSLLDGEFIKYNKKGELINTFAAFDIYFINKKTVREYAFYTTEETFDEKKKTRLFLLQNLISQINPKSIVNQKIDIFIRCKEFQFGDDIFEACFNIMSRINDNIYEYNTDGLIFTPMNMGVGGDAIRNSGPLHKITWDYSFKWKPPQFNTIDFLVSVKKDKLGNDIIIHYNDNDFKTLILRCGYDEEKHGYLNPSQDIYDDKCYNKKLDNLKYKPVAFLPTNPYDADACFCNVKLIDNIMKTEEGEYFEENMIIEFKYDITKQGFEKWVPLRVRYDKTSELKAGISNYGNAFHVANSNWNSIHNPITEEMITTGLNIPDNFENIEDSDVYYNRNSRNDSLTQSLRDFHNLYVKRKLISIISKKGDNLIDYAVGKAGDLNKWIDAKLNFVLGIDVSKDNIMNRFDGACSRYLNMCKKYNNLPSVLFIHGNSSQLIRNTDAFYTPKEKQIINSVFANDSKNVSLGKGVIKSYGIGRDGFNISSCQFALHYFFENLITLNNFVRNLSECTKLNGYFIGTTFDGETVFEKLKHLNQNESITINKDNKKIFEITKQYFQSGLPDNVDSLGMGIDVYQESINKVFREYLVNFNYFVIIMENYGFVLWKNKIGFESTDLFSNLFTKMEKEKKTNLYKSAINMGEEEKKISFLNRYFIFEKVRNVNTENVSKVILKEQVVIEKTKIKIKKIKKKIVIDKYSPISDDT
jgi:hypothetical protein